MDASPVTHSADTIKHMEHNNNNNSKEGLSTSPNVSGFCNQPHAHNILEEDPITKTERDGSVANGNDLHGNMPCSDSNAHFVARPATLQLASAKAEHNLNGSDHEAAQPAYVNQRIVALETKVANQENEILILKTCVCDLIRKLDHVTKAKAKDGAQRETLTARRLSGLSLSNLASMPGVLPSPMKSPTKVDEQTEGFSGGKTNDRSSPSPSSSPRRRCARQNSFDIIQHMASNKEGEGPMLKSTSQRRSSGTLRRSSSQGGSKDEVQSSKDDPKVKFYMRGRALTYYQPSWYRASKASSALPPQKTLDLEWVYGYRGRDSRNNLILLPSGDLVYNMAAVVVLYNRGSGRQRHYVGHNDDVKSIAAHPDGVTLASGQVAGHDKAEGKPHVRIWNSVTLETHHVLGIGEFERAVSCLAFSRMDDGKYLAVVDEANEHIVSLWDWKRERKLIDNKGYNEAVFGVDFSRANSNSFVTYGRSHIAFWTITDDEKLIKRMGIFEKHAKPKFIVSVAHNNAGDVISGDSNGNIFVWGQGVNKITQSVKDAHQGGVFSLCCLDDGSLLTGGGKDKRIKMWGVNLKKTTNEVELPGNAGAVRALIVGELDESGCREVIVGTTKNCILDGTMENGLGFIVQGHVDEMWGLASHPCKPLFVTCAYDCLVCLWNADAHENIWRKTIEESAQSAAFHPSEDVLVIGTRSGKWLVFDIEAESEVANNTDSSEQVDVMKYSPDGQLLAVGTHENAVTVYECQDHAKAYKKLGKLMGHSSFVTHLDWSNDSQFIQTNSGDYEILYWHATSCRQVVSASAMKDVQWQTWTCVFGFPVMGIWPEGADGTDINTCCRSSEADLVATGDDFGKVSLFAFPSATLKAQAHLYKGHSSHVTCVRFTHDGKHLISVGGKDSAVLQWKVNSQNKEVA